MKKLYLLVLFFVISSLHVHAWLWDNYWDYVGKVGDDIEAWFYPARYDGEDKLEFRGSGDFYSKYRQGSANEGSHFWDWTYVDGSAYSADIALYCDIVEFKDGIISVPDVAFRLWPSIREVILPQSVQCIGYRSFMDCDGLKEVTFYGNTVGQDAFKGCDALETFTIDPKHGQVNIGQQSFSWFGPKKLIIKSNDPDCAYVHPEAFYEARHDITLCVPRAALEAYNNHPTWKNWWRIESIEHQMTLEEYELNSNPAGGIAYGMRWSLVNGVLRLGGVEDIQERHMAILPIELDSVIDMVIEEGVKSIGVRAMYSILFNNLLTIRLPESLNTLNYYSFGACHKLKKLKFHSSISFHSVFIWNTSALKEIWVTHRPSSMESTEYVFVHQSPSTILYVKDANDVDYYLSTPPWSKFSTIEPMGNRGECGEIIDWEVKDSTLILEGRDRTYDYEDAQSVPWYSRKDIIRNMTVGDPLYPNRTITCIGKNVIGNCSNLKKIKLISETPPAVHSETFQNIDFNQVVLEVPYTSLEAYRNAPGWKDFGNITFSTSGQCGDDAFWEYKDKTLTVSGTGSTYDYAIPEDWTLENYGYNRPWHSFKHLIEHVVIGEGITRIGNCCFTGFLRLINIKFSESLTCINFAAFAASDSLRSVIISSNVTHIEQYAFSDCNHLGFISIPEGVNSLDWREFYGCTSLAHFVCLNPNPPSIKSDNVFYTMNPKSVTLYVPEESIGKYKAARYWRDFGDIQKLENAPSLEVASGESSSVAYTKESDPPLPYNIITVDSHDSIIQSLPYFYGYMGLDHYWNPDSGKVGWNVYSHFGTTGTYSGRWSGFLSYGVATSDTVIYLTGFDTIFQLPRTRPTYVHTLEVYNPYTDIITVTTEGKVIPIANGTGYVTLYRIGAKSIIPPIYNTLLERGFYADCRTWRFNVTGVDETLLKHLKVNSDSIKVSDATNYAIAYPYTSSVAEIRVLPKHTTSKLEGTTYDNIFKNYYMRRNLAVGDNLFHFAVRSKDGSQLREYTVNVKRTGDPRLKSLNVSEGTLQPQFNPDIYEYRVDIPYTKEITVTAQSYDPSNLIKGTGKYSLDPVNGEVVYEVTSTSPDGLTKTYRLNIVSTEAVLKTLKVSHDESTLFTYNETNLNHTLYVGHNVEQVHLEAESYKAENVEGIGLQTLSPGENLLPITIIDKNGTKKTYQFTIVRAKNSNAALKTLSATAIDVSRGRVISEEVISLNFNPNIFNYNLILSNMIDSIKINAIPERGTSTVTGIGAYPLNVGDNLIELKVRAADGTVLVYTVNARRISADAGLGYLTVSYGNEIHEFDVSKTSHTLNIENDIKNITLDFAPNYPSASFRPGDLYAKPGIKSPAVGNNSFYIGVLAEDGQTDELYTVNIYRLPARSHASSTSLREVSGQLTHVYMQGQTLYIDSPSAEWVTVYSVAGELLYGLNKPSGKASFTVSHPGSLLIVRGSSGWVRKIRN